jgi:hypothetical protein
MEVDPPRRAIRHIQLIPNKGDDRGAYLSDCSLLYSLPRFHLAPKAVVVAFPKATSRDENLSSKFTKLVQPGEQVRAWVEAQTL